MDTIDRDHVWMALGLLDTAWRFIGLGVAVWGVRKLTACWAQAIRAARRE